MTRFGCLVAALLFAAGAPAHASGFEGVVTRVTDGDTLWVQPASGGPPRAVRLAGVDAPEICQAFGRESRDALAAHVLHRRVQVRSRAVDDYQRTLAHVSVAGEELAPWLVARGYAWSYRFRSDPGPYAKQEAQAKQARLGLWRSGDPMLPREFRKQHGSCKPGR